MKQDYLVIAFYLIAPVGDPLMEVKRLKKFFKTHDAMGRVYINEEGINAQMSISAQDAPSFYNYLFEHEHFKGVDVKVHKHHEHVFPKKTIKYRKQLVALDRPVNFSKGGKHASAKEWKEMLSQKDGNTIVLDVRNDYEWELGHFEGAIKPQCKTFREFHDYVIELQKELDPKKTRVLMYCTGGIRCEFYSCLMKEEGFDEVYQLDGGIIKYGLEEGVKHWKGQLFVFDDRLSIPIKDGEESEVIGTCHHCKAKTEIFINCANMDCNELFLCCLECAKVFWGCCSNDCQEAPHRRNFNPEERPKPFRKLPFELKQKMRQQAG